jgi:hypothetical protein
MDADRAGLWRRGVQDRDPRLELVPDVRGPPLRLELPDLDGERVERLEEPTTLLGVDVLEEIAHACPSS